MQKAFIIAAQVAALNLLTTLNCSANQPGLSLAEGHGSFEISIESIVIDPDGAGVALSSGEDPSAAGVELVGSARFTQLSGPSFNEEGDWESELNGINFLGDYDYSAAPAESEALLIGQKVSGSARLTMTMDGIFEEGAGFSLNVASASGNIVLRNNSLFPILVNWRYVLAAKGRVSTVHAFDPRPPPNSRGIATAYVLSSKDGLISSISAEASGSQDILTDEITENGPIRSLVLPVGDFVSITAAADRVGGNLSIIPAAEARTVPTVSPLAQVFLLLAFSLLGVMLNSRLCMGLRQLAQDYS